MRGRHHRQRTIRGLPARVEVGRRPPTGSRTSDGHHTRPPGGPLPESVGTITGRLWRVHKHSETERPAFNYLPPLWVTGPVHQLITLKTWLLFSDSLSQGWPGGSTVRKEERKKKVDKLQKHPPSALQVSESLRQVRREAWSKGSHNEEVGTGFCFLSSNWTSVYSKMTCPKTKKVDSTQDFNRKTQFFHHFTSLNIAHSVNQSMWKLKLHPKIFLPIYKYNRWNMTLN